MENQSVNDIAAWVRDDPCPAWCAGKHMGDQHPEDRAHYSEALPFPVVIPTGQAYRKRGAEPAEFMVCMRRYQGEAETWVFIGNGEDTRMSIEISLESARRLCRRLTDLLSTRGS